MDDAPLVCGPESLGDLDREVEQAVGGQRLAAHEFPQRPAVEQLHHEVGRSRWRPTSWTVQMFGWLSPAASRASR